MKLIKLVAIILVCLVLNTKTEAQNGFFNLKQPDGTAFLVKEMGVCWLRWFETPEGYMVQKGKDRYYHYVTINGNGEFVQLPQKAGKDRAVSIPVRPYENPAIRAKLLKKALAYNQAADENRARFLQKQREALELSSAKKNSLSKLTQLANPLTIEVGVLLVEFDNLPHYTGGNRPNGYFVNDFEDMLFSNDYYHTAQNAVESPDDEEVFGSLLDYFEYQSHGILTVNGHVVNPTNANGTPRWINLGASVYAYPIYAGVAPHFSLYRDAINAAIDSSWNVNQDMHIIILAGSNQDGPYAAWGGTGFHRGFFNRNNFDPGFYNNFDNNWYGAAGYHERNSAGEGGNVSFSHIGIFAHEAFHVMGWGIPNVDGSGTEIWLHTNGSGNDWSLMYTGTRTGPFRKGECPGDLDPVAKVMMEWAEPTDVTVNMENEQIQYVETDNDVAETLDFYRLDDPYSNEEFIVENRQFSGFNSYLPEWWQTGDQGGLLFWRHASATSQARSLRPGDNDFDINAVPPELHWAGGDAGDPFPGESNNTAITPYTTPNTDRDNGNFTGVAVTNISISSTNMTANFYADFQPDNPVNFRITNRSQNGANPILQWDANTEPDLNHYAIYRGYQYSKTAPINWLSSPSGTTANTTWTDPIVTISSSAGSRVNYRVTAVDDASNESSYSNSDYVNSFDVPKAYQENTETTATLPTQIRLHSNYPNPFNPETQVQFDLPEATQLRLTIYNIVGAEVQTLTNGFLPAGFHSVTWNGKDTMGTEVASGVYTYRLEIQQSTSTPNNLTFTKKMMLLR